MSEPHAPSHAAPAVRVPHRRALVWAIVALLIADLVTGAVAGRRAPASAERDRLAEGATRVAEHEGRPRVVVVGAVGTDAFIDAGVLGTALGPDSLIEEFQLNSGNGALWEAAYRHLYQEGGVTPDAVVVAFQSEQLEDRSDLDWATVGRLYTDWGSLGDRWSEAPDLASKIDVVASRASALVGHRSWIRGIWSDRVPDYASVPRREPRDDPDAVTFTSLGDFVVGLTAEGVAVTVVAIPRVSPYVVPDELLDAVETAGGAFLDLRQVLPPREEDATGALRAGELEKLSLTVAAAIDGSLRPG
ncbi:MAG: hypothetical protein AAF480_16755 [Actinomycetota bacterium]